MENTELATVQAAPSTAMSAFPGASRMTIYNAVNNALSLSKEAPKSFELLGIICNPGNRAVSGDPCINTYLVAADGTAYFTQSTGIARGAQDLLNLYAGNVAGLEIEIIEREIGGGLTVKGIKVLSEPHAE